MSAGPVVCNASPLIALEQIRRLDLLEHLFTRVCVPPAVVAEISRAVHMPSWLSVMPLAGSVPAPMLAFRLGAGEIETIALAVERQARRVILDDLPARKAARRLGLPVVGTLGILLAAKRYRFIPAVGPSLEALVKVGFRVGPDLYHWVMRRAGEGL